MPAGTSLERDTVTIRDSFTPEVGGLGPKVERKVEAPQPRQVAPGIRRNPDGKLETNLPLPPIARPDVVILEDLAPWPFTVPPDAPVADVYCGSGEVRFVTHGSGLLEGYAAGPDVTPAFLIADED